MMRRFILLITAIFLFTGCDNDSLFQNGSSQRTSPPINTTIYKSPLAMSVESVVHSEDYVDFLFILEHGNGTSIASDDYQFQWPKYVSDEDETIYKVESVEYSHSEISNQPLENHQLAVTLRVSPPPPKGTHDKLVHVPLYIVPRLFEEGYPFLLDDTEVDYIEVGDLALRNVLIDENIVTFDLRDLHPNQNKNNLAYIFSRFQDDQEIYPMFSRVDPEQNHLNVELEFVQNISIPARFSIERTTVDLPEWRFSFNIPFNIEEVPLDRHK
ncbi:hypothetical protein ACM26V_10200 [Salipaludibacillus sp. HK11]|uniref:hypothetical protein n=1 Tax=Salipaludibacillus sp. HK11 TaxID=3394320 RepID=UPI0039FD97EA